MDKWHVEHDDAGWVAFEEGHRSTTERHYRRDQWRSAYAYADINAHPLRAVLS